MTNHGRRRSFLGQVYDSTFEGFDVGGMHDNFMKFSYDVCKILFYFGENGL